MFVDDLSVMANGFRMKSKDLMKRLVKVRKTVIIQSETNPVPTLSERPLIKVEGNTPKATEKSQITNCICSVG